MTDVTATLQRCIDEIDVLAKSNESPKVITKQGVKMQNTLSQLRKQTGSFSPEETQMFLKATRMLLDTCFA